MEEIKKGYDRVSDILSQWNQYAGIPKHVLENKCRIGTDVHETIAACNEGIWLESNEDAKGYIKSYLEWKKDNENLLVVETEKRLYCDDLKITGALDAIVEIGEVKYIIDYKTSASSNLATWALQGSFYHYLAMKNGYDVNPFVFFLHLQKDGSKAIEHTIECTEALEETAMAAYQTFQHFKVYKNVKVDIQCEL